MSKNQIISRFFPTLHTVEEKEQQRRVDEIRRQREEDEDREREKKRREEQKNVEREAMERNITEMMNKRRPGRPKINYCNIENISPWKVKKC